MYSANLKDQLFSAAIPLKPFVNWVGSAGTVAVALPPAPAVAGISVAAVGVSIALPQGLVATAEAVHVAGTPIWSATFAADVFVAPGLVADGLTVTVSGTDEAGASRVWFVARGDVEIRSAAAVPAPGDSYYLFKLRDAAPDAPVEGDVYVSDSVLYVYVGGEWQTIGGSSVVVDPTLTQPGAAADAKVTGDALRSGFTEWVADSLPEDYVLQSCTWSAERAAWSVLFSPVREGLPTKVALIHGTKDDTVVTGVDFSLSRHLITPTKTSQLTNDSGFITQHQQLTPVYSQTPTFSEWTFSDVSDGITDIQQPVFIPSPGGEPSWRVSFGYAGQTLTSAIYTDEDATNLAFEYADEGLNLHLTATRTRTDIIGYTLGTQADKPIQPQGDYVTKNDMETALPYPFVPVVVEQGVATIIPRTVATFTADSSAAAFTVAVGTGTAGTARDCELVIDCTATGAVAPTVTWPSSFHPRTDAGTDFACEAGVRNVFYISEYATGEFVVGGWHEEVA